MAQVGLQFANADLSLAPASLLHDHALFLRAYHDFLVTFGPISDPNTAVTGYAYQTEFPGTSPDAMREFLAADPFAKAGLYQSTVLSGWRCMLDHRQTSVSPRPGLQGFFFHGIANHDVTERRNALIDRHRAHLEPVDQTNCLARGGLTDADAKSWLGSAMVYEFTDRAELDRFFEAEPFRSAGLYARIDIYDWKRGVIAP